MFPVPSIVFVSLLKCLPQYLAVNFLLFPEIITDVLQNPLEDPNKGLIF